MKHLRAFGHTTTSGFYPVGSAAVVVAKDRRDGPDEAST